MTTKQRLAIGIATGCFVGYLPLAPGTFGSALGIGLLYSLRNLPAGFHFFLAIAVFLVGVWAANIAGRHYQMVDCQKIVIDEIAGVMITMLGIPLTGYWLVWGFILFRIFDILKPPPANIFDSRVKNAWGVMLDDVSAGIYGNIVLQLMWRSTI